jgi:hypothetical protein
MLVPYPFVAVHTLEHAAAQQQLGLGLEAMWLEQQAMLLLRD